jgi:hypothetical protein
MPQTVDRIDFACPDVDLAQWPKLSCGAANQLAIQDGGLRFEIDREILFQDNGQIRSFDDHHKLVFNRQGNFLDLHELGAIRFLTGAPTPLEKMRIGADGHVGIGTDAPGATLHIAGDLRIDSTLSVTGATNLAGNLRVGGAIDATDIRKNGTSLTTSQWNDVGAGINFAGGNVGIGTLFPNQKLHVVGNIAVSGTVNGVDISRFKADVDDRISRYVQFGNLNQLSINVDTTWVKLRTATHGFTKNRSDTKIEVHVHSRFSGGNFAGANGIHFQIRMDDLEPSIGNDAAITTSNSIEFLSMFSIFQNLPAGPHTVSIWARTPSGSSSGVLVDPGGWGGKIIVKECW